MEKVSEKDIEQFLAIGYGYGYGYGSGSGYGSGYGYGYGSGSGYGSGDGSGYGSGDGSGDGSGIKVLNGQKVYKVDGINTIFESIHGTYAKGFILKSDLTLEPTFIVKCGDYFAHGATLREALDEAAEKYEQYMPVEERIEHFIKEFPDKNAKIPAKKLFNWHHILTGSCKQGRLSFCEAHDIDLERDEFTMDEFIELTENSYGSDVIRKLKKAIYKH